MMVNYNLILQIERVEQVIEYKINVLLLYIQHLTNKLFFFDEHFTIIYMLH